MTTKCFPRKVLVSSRRPALRALPGPWLQEMPTRTHCHRRFRGVQSKMWATMAVLWIHIGLPPTKTKRNSMILFSCRIRRKASSLNLGEVEWLMWVYTQLSPPPPLPPKGLVVEISTNVVGRGGGAYYYYYYYYTTTTTTTTTTTRRVVI